MTSSDIVAEISSTFARSAVNIDNHASMRAVRDYDMNFNLPSFKTGSNHEN